MTKQNLEQSKLNNFIFVVPKEFAKILNYPCTALLKFNLQTFILLHSKHIS